VASPQSQKPAHDREASVRELIDRLASVNQRLADDAAALLSTDADRKAERALFRAMIDQVPDYLFVKDLESRFVIANKAVAADLGMKPDELIGKTDFDLHSRGRAEKFFADEQNVIRSGQPMIDIEEYIIDDAGVQKDLLTTKVPLRSDQYEIIGIVGVCRDVTARKRAEEEVRFLAHHDPLTRLPNRAVFMDRLAQAILQAERSGRWVTVAFVDLDNFKLVNDSRGHKVGDELLKTVAERMVGSTRATDTVVRLGGDEFVVLLADQPESTSTISAILEKVRAAIAEPIEIEGQVLHVTCSIGLATYPNDGSDAETLLKNADAAMYQAKTAGRDNFQLYTAAMNTEVHDRLSLHVDLRKAITERQFHLLYQPQIDLKTGRIFAVEALIRWDHPALGIVSPARFIPIAEETGLIIQIGDWVLRTACHQNKAWQDAGMPPVTVCVNVSARQFREKNWIDRVTEVLRDSGLEAKYLELELTESLLMHDVHHAIETMRALQSIGVQFSIDDFGTGYSSLAALKNFPVARLKIDRSFVHNLPHDEDDRGIATAVISLGQRLRMKVIAEGVETDEQLAFLSDHQCDEVQGYRFSEPVRPEAIEGLLKRQDPVS